MTAVSFIQDGIAEPGQSQFDRTAPELAPESFHIDPRTPEELMSQARALAELMPFYTNNPEQPNGDWTSFFSRVDPGSLLATRDGTVPPHLGLLGAFFELYQHPKALLNQFTARHLEFQYRRVLRFEPRAAQADRAMVIAELKRGAAPVAVTPEHVFSAGKDATGVELSYKPVRSVVVGHGRVAALRSVFRDATGLYFAPIANSTDGLGAPLTSAQPKWRGFGHRGLSSAPVGFALSSPTLRMREGKRRVRLELTLGGLDSAKHTNERLADAFRAYVTGPKGWLGPFRLGAELQSSALTLSFELPATEPAVVDYDAAIHSQAPQAAAPVVQLLLEPGASLRYDDLSSLAVNHVRVRVDVEGVTSLALENDLGSLNPKKAFLPFGPQPAVGSRFMIGCDEALSKSLTDLRIGLTWQAAPDLGRHYSGYINAALLNRGVPARLVYQDHGGQTTSVGQDLMQRVDGRTTLSPRQPQQSPMRPATSSVTVDRGLFGLLRSGSAIARTLARKRMLEHPMRSRVDVPPPSARSGFVTVALEQDFLHADYRRESVDRAVNKQPALNPPYTPTAQDIQLDYAAVSGSNDLTSTGMEGEASLAEGDVQFWHVGCFGYAREHAFLRAQVPYVANKAVRLLPQYPDEGELLIGLTGALPGDSVSLLLQVAPGSADPELQAQDVQWSVLCDNYWRPLVEEELVLDQTNHMTASGIVAFTLPFEASTEHSWMPRGYVWLRAAMRERSAAACELITIAANAVEVVFVDQGNDPAHLGAALAAGSIAKMKAPLAAIKKVEQPFASFGGRAMEDDAALSRRASERARHRQRCITPWDYERLLLEAFPSVHKVKCIPHASERSWLAPGHVLLIAVADLRNQNAVDTLTPRVDLDTLTRMADYARAHSGAQICVRAKNPRYQRVRLEFNVRFLPGLPFNYYRNELERALIRALTPWAFDATRPLEFGGRLYRSVLLDLVEEFPYVDLVSDFRMGLEVTERSGVEDVSQLSAEAPDVIFTSAEKHLIAPF